MKTLISFFAVLASFATGYQGAPADGAAFVIDGQHVPWREYGAWLVAIRGESQLEPFVNLELLERRARSKGIELSDEAVQEHIRKTAENRIEQAFGGDRQRWLDELARVGTSEETYLVSEALQVRPQLLANKILAADRIPSDDELQRQFERRYGRHGRKLDVRALRLRLVVETPPNDSSKETRLRMNKEAKERLQARLVAIRERVRAGEDFGQLIVEYSEDRKSAAAGGRLANFQPDAWPADVMDALHALEPGELSEPVYGRGFYNLFEVMDVQETPFETVREELRAELRERPVSAAEMGQLLQDLSADTNVEVRPAIYSGGDDPTDIIAVIEGREVTRGEFAIWLGRSKGETLARSFVESRLIEREAAALGITVTDEDVALRIERDIASQIDRFHDGDRDKWLAELAARGKTPEQAHRDRRMKTRSDLLAEQLILSKRDLSDNAVQQRWKDEYGPEGRLLEIRMLRKMVALPPEAASKPQAERERLFAAAQKETLAKLSDLRARVLDGEDFGALAERESDDAATRTRGGHFPDSFEKASLPTPVHEALATMKPGEVTEPMMLGPGCYLFELVSLQVVPFESVKAELREAMNAELPGASERAGYLNSALIQSDWQVFPQNFR